MSVHCVAAFGSTASKPTTRRQATYHPGTATEKPREGEVIAVGPGARDEAGQFVPLDVKAGDRILFGRCSGTDIKLNGEDLLIMKESDAMGGSQVAQSVGAQGRNRTTAARIFSPLQTLELQGFDRLTSRLCRAHFQAASASAAQCGRGPSIQLRGTQT